MVCRTTRAVAAATGCPEDRLWEHRHADLLDELGVEPARVPLILAHVRHELGVELPAPAASRLRTFFDVVRLANDSLQRCADPALLWTARPW